MAYEQDDLEKTIEIPLEYDMEEANSDTSIDIFGTNKDNINNGESDFHE